MLFKINHYSIQIFLIISSRIVSERSKILKNTQSDGALDISSNYIDVELLWVLSITESMVDCHVHHILSGLVSPVSRVVEAIDSCSE